MKFFVPSSPQPAAAIVQHEVLHRGHSTGREDCDAAYVRLTNYGPSKRESLGTLDELHRAGVPTIPEAIAVELYDDKAAQVPFLEPWMPRTAVFTDPGKAATNIPAAPFISKAAHGSGSKNVRLIETRDAAVAEIEAAFGRGIECINGVQQGYVIWQDFIAGNAGDLRVCVTGDYLFGLHRDNRADAPFASGSGSNRPVLELDRQAHAAFALAREIADELGTRWCCFDFVFGDDRPLCLEISFAWSEGAYAGCMLFGRDLAPTGRPGSDWPVIAVDELERLAR